MLVLKVFIAWLAAIVIFCWAWRRRSLKRLYFEADKITEQDGGQAGYQYLLQEATREIANGWWEAKEQAKRESAEHADSPRNVHRPPVSS